MKRNFFVSLLTVVVLVLSGCTENKPKNVFCSIEDGPVSSIVHDGSTENKPKYVFYFIGDGMGLNIVHAAEYYKAAEKGIKYKADSINFAHFPVIGFANTSSSNSYITDSAAAGTALACGEKTKQGTIGMDDSQKTPLKSIATHAKDQGKGVAILTSVSIDHATPASFFGHRASRSEYYDIALDGATSNIDFFGGSGFVDVDKNGKEKNVYEAYAENGYTRFKGKSAIGGVDSCTTKVVITERDGVDNESFAYAIDRKSEDLSLADLVSKATDYLFKKYKDEGFMVVAEGGKVDWAAHANDIKASIGEVIDLEQAVAIAYQFYLQHPDETLIVVTADHETGGYANANSNGGYSLAFDKIVCNIPSREVYGKQVSKAIEARVKFEELPMPGDYNFSDKELDALKEIYANITDPKVIKGDEKMQKSMYEKAKSNFAIAAYDMINRGVCAGWTTGGHSGSPVMIYSVGAGAENFGGHKDNTDIPKAIAALINLK